VPVDRNVLDEGQLARLASTRFGPFTQLGETTSTNSVAAARAREGAPQGLVVVADNQSAGRGRFQRRWESQPGGALLFSVLLRPGAELPLPRRHLVSAALALALAGAARSVAGVAASLKWPNDVIAGAGDMEAKLAGILAEGTEDGAVVAGAGMNISWAPELQGPGGAAGAMRPISLQAAAGRPVARGEVLVAALVALDGLYGRWDLVADRYRQECATLGRTVRVSRAGPAGRGVTVPDVVGTAVDLDGDGLLVVRTGRGELVTVAAGDVVHVRPPSL
jgi:BirA family biotin operon repressor/biotin-[acetyl-CoA-carboxylase] ligase